MSGPWQTKPEGVPCAFVDGKTAQSHEVYADLRAADEVLVLSFGGAQDTDRPLTWALSDMRYVEGQHGLRRNKARMAVFTSQETPNARLYVRDAGLLHALDLTARHLKRRPPVTGRKRLAGLISGAIAAVALIVFVLIPIMSDQLARLLPIEGERALGDRTYEQIRTSFSEGFFEVPECTAPSGVAALNRMNERLLAVSGLDPDAVRLTVLDLDMINAFALPGGRIVIMNGLIDAAESPEEVAAVLAHEMGHVAHRDPTRHALRAVGTFGVLSLVFGDFAGGTLVLMSVNQLVNAQYSQGAESAADSFAHDLLPKAGVSPGAMAPLFERLKAEYGDVEGIASHLASHPALGDRVARAEAAADGYDGDLVPILSAADWQALRAICGGAWEDAD